MKKLITLIPLLLLGCSEIESENQTSPTYNQNNSAVANTNVEDQHVLLNNLDSISADTLSTVEFDRSTSSSLQSSNIQQYNAEDSLNKILNSGDTREIVYLIHPSNQMLVYCFHDSRSECYIEGIHDHKFFKYDISQVEGQNKGKLTSPGNPIDSARTTPMEWMTVTDEYVMVLMTSKIMLNSQQNTLHEPLIIDYKKGMMVR